MACALSFGTLNTHGSADDKVTRKKVSFLMFCVDMPTEEINNDFVDPLNRMSVSKQKSDVDCIIIGGDFITDFSHDQSQHTLLLCLFLESVAFPQGIETKKNSPC